MHGTVKKPKPREWTPEEALSEFTGSILFTSHDQAFVERLAMGLVEVNG